MVAVPLTDSLVDHEARVVVGQDGHRAAVEHHDIGCADHRRNRYEAGDDDQQAGRAPSAHARGDRHARRGSKRERQRDPVVPVEQSAGQERQRGEGDPRGQQDAGPCDPPASGQRDNDADERSNHQRHDRRCSDPRRDTEAVPVGIRRVEPTQPVPGNGIPPRAEPQRHAVHHECCQHQSEPRHVRHAFAQHLPPWALTGEASDDQAHEHGKEAIEARLLE